MGSRKDVDQFADLAALVGLIAGGDRVLDAMRDMIAQDLLLDPAQRGAHGGNLGHDIDAVAVVLHHAGKTARLAFNALEPIED